MTTNPAHEDHPVECSEGASGAVAAYLRLAIFEGRFGPGERIRQEEVALATGTSRVPVREALRALEGEGLVQLFRNRGARVARLDLSEFSELYRIREELEPLLLTASVPLLSDEQIDRLEELADDAANAADDLNLWTQRDRRFHLESFALEAMPQTFRLARDLWNRTQQYRRNFIATLNADQFGLIDNEHRMIIDSIRRRDAEGAADNLRLHIRRTRLGLMERQDLFDAS
jgi:DNA-binding GntR family transcriptional regulator